PPTASVHFGDYELSPSVYLVLDGNSVQVGFPCFYTGLGLPLGPLDVSVFDGARSVTGAGAFTVVDTTIVDLGAAPTDSVAATDPDANALQVKHDFDVYEWSAPAAGSWLSEAIVDSGASVAFKPYQFVTSTSFQASFNGAEGVIVPSSSVGAFYTQVADYHVSGAATGFGYRVRMTPLGVATSLAAADTCSAGAALTTAGLFTVDLSGAASDYDPAGAIGCVDRHSPMPPIAGEGVHAAGGDRALHVLVPAGATLEAVARGVTTDVVLYLIADSGSPCSSVTSCLDAADQFGLGDSETLLWKNTTGADQSAWLIIDDFGGAQSTPGPVTLLLRTN
ncbi:MAG TPA: hypothetical protein VMV18_05865, partial [bacterium]|nr:hypothetical protein [bacterium]